MRRVIAPIVLASAFALTGCTSYYSVSDPSTGKTYYTKNVKTKDGATHFEDAATGKEINIQNSEVAKINKDQYLAGMGSKTTTTVSKTTVSSNTADDNATD